MAMSACPGYKFRSRLGEGGFGVVYLAERQRDKQLFAVKAIKNFQTSLDERLLQDEITALSSLSHPHVVALSEVVQDCSRTYVVMEFCSGGDLRRLLNYYLDAGLDMPERRVKSILYQLVLALHHCHHSYFGGWMLLHRDIKPENVLFDGCGVVKLGDFGLSRILEGPHAQAASFVGTRGYLAPEILLGSGYDAKADMYSLGCLLLEMCTLSPLYASPGSQAAHKVPTLSPIYSADIRKLLRQLLDEQPAARPSSADLLSHACFAFWVHDVRTGKQQANDVTLFHLEQELAENNARLLAKEAALKSRARELDAREATLESKMRRLAFRASTSPPPASPKKVKRKSPPPVTKDPR